MSIKFFFSSRLAVSLGDQFLLFVVPIMVFQITQSIAWSSFAFALETIPRVIYNPFAGIIGDRYPPLKVVKLSLWLRSVFCVAAIVGSWLLGEQALLSIIIILSALVGLASTQGFISTEVLLPHAFKQTPFARVQAWVQSVDQLSIICGPLLAAFVLQYFSWQSVITVACGLFAVGQLLFSFSSNGFTADDGLQEKARQSGLSANNQSVIQQLQRSLDFLLNNKKLLSVVGQTALVNLVFGAAMATAAAFVSGKFLLPATSYGLLQMMGALTSIAVLSLTALFVNKLALKTIGYISFSCICFGGALYALGQNYWLFFIGFMIVLGFDGMFNVYIRTTRQALIPPSDYGKTTGVIIFFNNSTKPVAGLLIGAFSGLLSAETVIVALVLCCAGLGAVLFALAETGNEVVSSESEVVS
ncbi:MAG: MFS transporter [Pseudomonadales bacterium]|nr:MFS transporter [Pseudomonadales bacterium]NRA14272.1 MFS transporter [Oceanospirillaceae bacterium]